jgi:hypothetical protein
VVQERNEHDLMIDFRDEIPGYLHNERIRRTLEDLDLKSGIAAIPDNLVRCYNALIDMELVGADERPLLEAFLDDMVRIS